MDSNDKPGTTYEMTRPTVSTGTWPKNETSERMSSINNLALSDDNTAILCKASVKIKELINKLCTFEETYMSNLIVIQSELANIKLRLQQVKEMDVKEEFDMDQLDMDEQEVGSNPSKPVCADSNFYCQFGMPYFKIPSKPDTIRPTPENPFTLPYPKYHWTQKRKEKLVAIIKKWEIERNENENKSALETLKIQINNTKDPADLQLLKTEYQKLLKYHACKMDLKSLVETGKENYNWDQVSIELRNKHSPFECETMWNVYLHPKFKKTFWSTSEDDKLIAIAAKYKHQNWEVIATELGTGRSSYACFLHFQTRLNADAQRSWWTPEEDKRLATLVEKNRINGGRMVSWGKVLPFMPGRTHKQVLSHWRYVLDPHIERGRFTAVENHLLIRGVRCYGRDSRRIRIHFLPWRTAVQIREHAARMMPRTKRGSWTPDDDALLLRLVARYGEGHWSQVKEHFFDRNSTQIRFRYAALAKDRTEKKRFRYRGPRTLELRQRLTKVRLTASLHDALAMKATKESETVLPLSPVVPTRKMGRPFGKKNPSSIEALLVKFVRENTWTGTIGRAKKYTCAQVQAVTNILHNTCVVLDAKIKAPLVDIVRKHIMSMTPNAMVSPSDSSTSSTFSTSHSTPTTLPMPSSYHQQSSQTANVLHSSDFTDTQTVVLPLPDHFLTPLSLSWYENDVQPHLQSLLRLVCEWCAIDNARKTSVESETSASAIPPNSSRSELNPGLYYDWSDDVASSSGVSSSFETKLEPSKGKMNALNDSKEYVSKREQFPKSYYRTKTSYFFPPNLATLTGFRALMLAEEKIGRWADKHYPFDMEESRAGVEAKQRWIHRCKQLFLFPQLMSEKPMLAAGNCEVVKEEEEEEIQEAPSEKRKKGRPRKSKAKIAETRPKRKYVYTGKYTIASKVGPAAVRSLRSSREASEGSSSEGKAVESASQFEQVAGADSSAADLEVMTEDKTAEDIPGRQRIGRPCKRKIHDKQGTVSVPYNSTNDQHEPSTVASEAGHDLCTARSARDGTPARAQKKRKREV